MVARTKNYFFLLVAVMVLYLPGIFLLPALDRDETWYAEVTKEMLDEEDYFSLKFCRYKPIASYWARIITIKALNLESPYPLWAYRLPSVLATMLSVFLVFNFIQKRVSRNYAIWASLGLATSFSLVSVSQVATTDALLLLTIVLMQFSLYSIYNRYLAQQENLREIFSFWFWMFIGALIKGPVAPLVGFGTILALISYHRSFALLKSLKLFHFMIAGILALIGYVALFGMDFINFAIEMYYADIHPKITTIQQSHGGFIGYFTLFAFITFWPISLLLPAAVMLVIKNRIDLLKSPLVIFLLSWIIPTWIVFELAPTKLPHYTLPTYPAMVILITYLLEKFALKQWPKVLIICGGVLATILPIALLFTGYFVNKYLGYQIPLYQRYLLDIAGILSLYCIFKTIKQTSLNYLKLLLINAIFISTFTLTLLIPQIDGLWVARNVKEAIQQDYPAIIPANIAVINFSEPSIVFELSNKISFLHNEQAVSWLREKKEEAAIIVNEYNAAAFEELLSRDDIKISQTRELAGFNYSKGKKIKLIIYYFGK